MNPRSPIRYLTILGFPLLASLLLITGLACWHTYDSAQTLRQQTIEAASLRARQLDDSLSESVSMLFNNIDLVLLDLIDDYRISTVKGFEHHSKRMLGFFPEDSIFQIAVIGLDGRIKYSTLGNAAGVYVGDREQVSTFFDEPTDRLYISKPMIGVVSKRWTIYFTRPILSEGKLQGVMLLSLSPYYLYNTVLRLKEGVNDTLWIARSSGEYFARNLDMEKFIGFVPNTKRDYDDSEPGETGSFTSFSPLDNVERLNLWRHLERYPVIVNVGISQQDLLQPVEASIQRDYIKAALGTLALWVSSLFVLMITLKIKEQIDKRAQSDHSATHDLLTGLGNRKFMTDSVPTLIKHNQTLGQTVAILFMDLDGFKDINDTYGHDVGDIVLKSVAGRVVRCIRAQDIAIRLGGDEFVVVCTELDSVGEVQIIVDRIYKAISNPISFDHQTMKVGISIGVATYPDDGRTLEQLLAIADKRMYEEKSIHNLTRKNP